MCFQYPSSAFICFDASICSIFVQLCLSVSPPADVCSRVLIDDWSIYPFVRRLNGTPDCYWCSNPVPIVPGHEEPSPHNPSIPRFIRTGSVSTVSDPDTLPMLSYFPASLGRVCCTVSVRPCKVADFRATVKIVQTYRRRRRWRRRPANNNDSAVIIVSSSHRLQFRR